jgi:cell division septal protein FtsQ
MKKIFKYHYSKVVDKVRVNIDALKPYLEKTQKTTLSFSLWLVIVIVAVMAIMWLGKSTWQYLSNRSIFVVSPVTFSFDTPSWATDKLINEIKNFPGLEKKYNIFEKDLTRKIAETYEKNPLIYKVYHIERELPDTVNLKLELRKPIAIVKRKRNEYLVDKDCVRLLDKFYEYPERGENPVYIISSKLSKIPKYGEKWDDRSIKEGMNLLNYLRYNGIDKLLKIATIDVSNVARRLKSGKSDIILCTENGTIIKWGCPPSCERPNELSNYEKLQNLLSVAKEEGTTLANMEYVDVRWKVPLGKRIAVQ